MVEFYLGKKSRFSYGKEGSYGTVPAEWGYIPVQTVTPTSKSTLEQINTLDSTASRNVDTYFESLRTYGATVEGLIQHFKFCTLAWGTDSYALGTHTIIEAEDLTSASMNFGYDHTSNDHIMELSGGKINKLDISCTKGEFLKFSAEVVSQTSRSSPSWRAYNAGDTNKYYSITDMQPYHYSGVNVKISGTDYCETDSIKLSINNNLLSEPTLCGDNGKRIMEPVPQIREYDASATVRMSTTALYDLWEADAEIPGVTSFTFTVGSRVLTFTLVGTRFESSISPLNITEGIVLVELPMKVRQITVTEENSIAEAY